MGIDQRSETMTERGKEEGRLDSRIVAEVLAALAYGERCGARRAHLASK